MLDIPVVPQRAVDGSESPKVQWKHAVHRRSGGRSNGCTKSRFHDLEFLRAQKTVSVPQALKTDRAVNVSVVTQSQDSISLRVQTAVLAPQAQSIDETMGNPRCATESKFSAVLTKTFSGHAETDADHPENPED